MKRPCPLCLGRPDDDFGACWGRGFLCPVCAFYRTENPMLRTMLAIPAVQGGLTPQSPGERKP